MNAKKHFKNALLIVFLSGCGGDGGSGGTREVPKIYTSGYAERKVQPNLAFVFFAVVTRASQAEKARADNASKVAALLAKIHELRLGDENLQTMDYRLGEVLSYKDGTSKIDGYEAVNNMKISLRDIKLVGKVIDQVISSGATKIEKIEFDVAEREEIYRELLEQATTIAKEKATRIADASSLGKVTVLEAKEETSNDNETPMRGKMMMEAGSAASTPISGMATLKAHVSLVARTRD